MRRGWVCLEFDEDDLPEIGDISKEYKKADENSRWFFFQNNGKAKRSLTGNYDQETIHGEKFYFDRNGAMLTGWHAVKEKADSDDATGISVSYTWAVRTTEPLQRDSGNSCLSIPVIPTTGLPS